MKSIDELSDLMVELLENAKAYDDRIVFPARACEIIEEIAEFAKGTKIYSDHQEQSKNFWEEDATPTDIYYFMLQKIVNAPTQIHRNASVLLHMPALAEALKREDANK